jgi:hypothetical protein
LQLLKVELQNKEGAEKLFYHDLANKWTIKMKKSTCKLMQVLFLYLYQQVAAIVL